MSKQVYLAGPFFTPGQVELIERLKEVMDNRKISYFSPKDECMYTPGVTTPHQILRMNIEAIDECELIIVVTDGKDVGTLFEAGYAYGIDKEILYVWTTGRSEDKFNLMLAASGEVARSLDEVNSYLRDHRAISQEGIQYE